MKKFLLCLENDKNEFQIEFDILETPIAEKWALEISKNYPLNEIDRFQGWQNHGKDLNYYLNEIDNQINTINNYQNNTIIDNRDNLSSTIRLNYLHEEFVNLNKSINGNESFYSKSPTDVKLAIDRFNVMIHELEHVLSEFSHPSITCTYKNRPRHDLLEEDFQHFTFQWKFGHVYINYCENGKPLLDVFKNQDNSIDKNSVRPLKYYSADWMIKFDPDTPIEVVDFRLKKFNEWYKTTDYNFDYLNLGMIPVAKMSKIDTNIVNKISEYRKIKSTILK